MAFIEDSARLLAVLRARRKLAFAVFVTIFGLGLLIACLLPTKYTSSMRVLVRAAPTDLRATSERADGGTIGQVNEEEVNSEVELLTSYDLIRAAVVGNGLDSAEWSSTSDQRKVDAATRRLGKDLNVTAVRKANIIEVQYSAKSPRLAAAVLRSIESGYLAAHLRAQSTPGGYHFFENEVNYYKNRLIDKQQQFANFTEQEGAANLEQQLTLLTKAISDREAELQDARAQMAQATTEVSKSTSVVSDLSPRIQTTRKDVPNLSSIDHLTTLLADLEDRRVQQASKFRDNDPFLVETDQEITVVKRELEKANVLSSYEVATDVNPISQTLRGAIANKTVEMAGLQSKVNVLAKQLEADRSLVDHLTAISGEYRLLLGDVQNARDDYSAYVQHQEEARISESLDKNKISNVVISQEPTESMLPVSSHRLLIVVFSFFVALFLSIVTCLFADSLRPYQVLRSA